MQDFVNQQINFRPPDPKKFGYLESTFNKQSIHNNDSYLQPSNNLMQKRLLNQTAALNQSLLNNAYIRKKATTQLNSRQVSRENSASPVKLPQQTMGNIKLQGNSIINNQTISLQNTGTNNRQIMSQSVQRQYNNNNNNTSTYQPLTVQNTPRRDLQTSLDMRNNTNDQYSAQKQSNQKRKMNQSVDFVDRCNISIQDIIKSNMRKTTGDTVFGIADTYTKNREFVPGPKYDTVHDWKNNLRARGQFSKSPRVTFTESVIKEQKWVDYPGPGAYKHPDNFKKKKEKAKGALQDKFCEFIEEAKFVGLETPAPKYDVNYDRIDADMKYARIKPSKFSRMDKIQKDPKKPAPGDYNTIEAYNKTQTNLQVHKIAQSKNSCFVDQYQKAKQFLPGIGSYKVEPNVFKSVLSKSPVSIRTLRH